MLRLRAIVIALSIAVVALAAERLTTHPHDLYGKVKEHADRLCKAGLHADDAQKERAYSDARFITDASTATVFACDACCDAGFEILLVEYPSSARLEDALGHSRDWDGDNTCVVHNTAVIGMFRLRDCEGWGGHARPNVKLR